MERQSPTGLDRLLTPTEVGIILGLRKSTVYRMLGSGKLPSVLVTDSMFRRSFRIRPTDHERWLCEREVKTNRRR